MPKGRYHHEHLIGNRSNNWKGGITKDLKKYHKERYLRMKDELK